MALLALRAIAQRLLLRLADHLVGVFDVRRDLALLERPFDRVEHHRIAVVRHDDQHRLARLEDAHPFALQSGLVADERPRRGHEVVHRLRRFEIRRPARLGVFFIRLRAGARARAGAGGGLRSRFVGAVAGAGEDGGAQQEHAREQFHHWYDL